MNLTRLTRSYFSRFDRQMLSAAANAEASQRRLLGDLLATASSTLYGTSYKFPEIKSYEQFAAKVPIVGYEDLRPAIMRMVDGQRDVLWPGRVERFAQSSGTSGGKSKYIPLTARSLRQCHYRGGTDVVARYISLNPDSRLFDGRSFILGGSYANELRLHDSRVKVGDLSATLIDCINPLANIVRTPPKKIALMADWQKKLELMIPIVARQNVTNLSGVPSWFLTVLKRVLEYTGAGNIKEVWPNLEVFFHGGISFAPYREQYNAIIDPAKMKYMETYNASEGFFALQDDPADPAMLLLMDTDVFYEFLPLDQLETEHPRAVPSWEVEKGKTYALVITSSNGLWRYLIGDTVRVASLNPLKIVIAGRTKSFINAFGEELMVYNADAALARVCAQTGAEVANYTAGPSFATDRSKGCHQWLVEFNRMPESLDDFARLLDDSLQQENSDYQAKRSGDIFLGRLKLEAVPVGTFDRYLASTGKLGGQRKVPRLCNDRKVLDAIAKMLDRYDTTSDKDNISIPTD